ncbi:galactokinase-like [Ischnura elegans]|uniref:galactokinase-like n=1 Tax=Ischnura elegans TaxID=197161 RepID=UPI001ED8B70B|nr:galactokinase-like [Ischnura elegans]XP_046393188.1 galactokinase-like [Ischnura elegans]XP_046393189.1 galactokinase-like [Ischnura elegans]XP_046393190.1 galactokinase-like [Ischnura elegans]
MAASFASLEDLLKLANEIHKDEFGSLPVVAACAPGRVNLIGEHVDYCEGYVLPIALPMMTVVVGSRNNSDKCCVITTCDDQSKVEINLKSVVPGEPLWANYVKGVIKFFPGTVPGFNAVFVSSVPIGGGLSSSAALEMSTYTFLEALTGIQAKKEVEKALICQKAEHQFANVPCGIMDQFASLFGSKGHALLIDCRSLDHELVPMDDPSLSICVINSNIRHQLSSSEYPIRRQQCEDACKVLKKKSLRDTTFVELLSAQEIMDPVVFRRAQHVISEIMRTEEAAAALKSRDYAFFGKLMLKSHESLRDLFDVSCKEVDQLVDLAMEFGKKNNDCVLGCRMTGAGFGGCCVALVRKQSVNDLINYIQSHYHGSKPTFYEAYPSSGARILTQMK